MKGHAAHLTGPADVVALLVPGYCLHCGPRVAWHHALDCGDVPLELHPDWVAAAQPCPTCDGTSKIGVECEVCDGSRVDQTWTETFPNAPHDGISTDELKSEWSEWFEDSAPDCPGCDGDGDLYIACPDCINGLPRVELTYPCPTCEGGDLATTFGQTNAGHWKKCPADCDDGEVSAGVGTIQHVRVITEHDERRVGDAAVEVTDRQGQGFWHHARHEAMVMDRITLPPGVAPGDTVAIWTAAEEPTP